MRSKQKSSLCKYFLDYLWKPDEALFAMVKGDYIISLNLSNVQLCVQTMRNSKEIWILIYMYLCVCLILVYMYFFCIRKKKNSKHRSCNENKNNINHRNGKYQKKMLKNALEYPFSLLGCIIPRTQTHTK